MRPLLRASRPRNAATAGCGEHVADCSTSEPKKPKALDDPADHTFVTAGISREANRHSRYGSEGISVCIHIPRAISRVPTSPAPPICSRLADMLWQENDDFCSACSGSGLIICCERCPKSFHLTCTNPPLSETPQGVWFCNECLKREKPPRPAPRGLFSELLNRIERQNPAAYQLPEHIRTYYKGVSTGKTGQYISIPGYSVRKGGGAHK